MSMPQLYMVLLGCKPKGRHTEQHDIFFAIADGLKALVPAINNFWPEANGKIHLDAYRVVNIVDGYQVKVVAKEQNAISSANRLFFLNLGAYQSEVFEELHHKMLVVAPDKAEAIKRAKESEFFKRYFSPHVDDKYGVDVDEVFEIEEALTEEMKAKYQLTFQVTDHVAEDKIILGYMPIDKL